jgi:hypothetical protein
MVKLDKDVKRTNLLRALHRKTGQMVDVIESVKHTSLLHTLLRNTKQW